MSRHKRQIIAPGHTEIDPERRRLLRYGLHGLGMIACGKLLLACHNGGSGGSPMARQLAPLRESEVEGLLLPEGFSGRIVARANQPVMAGGDFLWHPAPDGGAIFPAGDGGWIYASNSEMDSGAGGVSALRFDAGGEIAGAYPILRGTNRNCAGGPTPWNTWLSCEEVEHGHVWECDPSGANPPRELPALGAFMHEAVAVDSERMHLYMTEDRPDGRFYRFRPDVVTGDRPDLSAGTLEVAEVHGDVEGPVTWHRIADPSGSTTETRAQVAASTVFAGGEGAWHANGIVYFTTKRDNRVWAYDTDTETLALIYDDGMFEDAVLTGVDNVTVSQAGTIYVAEDGGDMQIVAITPDQRVIPVVRIAGHGGSEVTGPAFDPSGTRLYFSSQRGVSGNSFDGVTYEVTGPFGEIQ